MSYGLSSAGSVEVPLSVRICVIIFSQIAVSIILTNIIISLYISILINTLKHTKVIDETLKPKLHIYFWPCWFSRTKRVWIICRWGATSVCVSCSKLIRNRDLCLDKKRKSESNGLSKLIMYLVGCRFFLIGLFKISAAFSGVSSSSAPLNGRSFLFMNECRGERILLMSTISRSPSLLSCNLAFASLKLI